MLVERTENAETFMNSTSSQSNLKISTRFVPSFRIGVIEIVSIHNVHYQSDDKVWTLFVQTWFDPSRNAAFEWSLYHMHR